MKFMCTVIVDTDIAERQIRADWAAITERSMAYDRQFMDRGVFIAAEALVGPEAARTARVRNGTAMVTDGPLRNQRKC